MIRYVFDGILSPVFRLCSWAHTANNGKKITKPNGSVKKKRESKLSSMHALLKIINECRAERKRILAEKAINLREKRERQRIIQERVKKEHLAAYRRYMYGPRSNLDGKIVLFVDLIQGYT